MLHHEGGRQIDSKLAFFQALPIVCFIRRINLNYISNSICTRRSPRFLNMETFLWSLSCSSSLISSPIHSGVSIQMARYPRLREETERIITTYIRYVHQKCSYFAPSRQKRTRHDPKILDYVTLPGLWGLLSLRCTKAKIIYLTLSGRRSRSARSRS